MHIFLFIYLFYSTINNDSIVNYSERKNSWLIDQNFYQISNNKIFVYDLENIKKSTIHIKNQPIDFDDYYPEVIRERILFFEKSGGLVYELLNDSLFRIDNSYSHKLSNKSLNFNFNNLHHRFGGYGFFERRKSIVYYDLISNEWQLKFNFENYLKNGYSDITFHTINDNKLKIFAPHIGGGEDGLSNFITRDIIEINLKNNTLKYIGELNNDFPHDYINYVSHNNQTFLLKDPKSIYIYNNIKDSFFIYKTNKNPKYLIGIYENRLYFYTHKTYERDNLTIDFIEFDDIFNSDSDHYSIFEYESSTFIFILFFIFLIIILILTSESDFSSKKLLIISGNKLLTNKGELIIVSDEQKRLILFLKHNFEVDNNKILDLLGNNLSDLGHQNRLKNKLIKSINDSTYSRFGMDLIIVRKNEFDKRSVVYSLNEDLV